VASATSLSGAVTIEAGRGATVKPERVGGPRW
jgi:hypothetical protein